MGEIFWFYVSLFPTYEWKQMLVVLGRGVSVRESFWAPWTSFEVDEWENFPIFG